MNEHTYFVIDRRSNSIVNAMATTLPITDPTLLRGFTDAEHLYLDEHPPMAVLERYQYWSERP